MRHLILLLRWAPAAALACLMAVVAIWTLSMPMEDVRASVVGFVLMSVLALGMLPALHVAIEPGVRCGGWRHRLRSHQGRARPGEPLWVLGLPVPARQQPLDDGSLRP